MKIKLIKELEEIELKPKMLKAIEGMKESLGEFKMKILKNEIKALQKIARKNDKNIKRKKRKIRQSKNGDIRNKNKNKSRIGRIRNRKDK